MKTRILALALATLPCLESANAIVIHNFSGVSYGEGSTVVTGSYTTTRAMRASVVGQVVCDVVEGQLSSCGVAVGIGQNITGPSEAGREDFGFAITGRSITLPAGPQTVTASTFRNTNIAGAVFPGGAITVNLVVILPDEPGPLDLELIARIDNLDLRIDVLEAAIPLIQNDITSLQNALTLLQSTVAALNFVTNVVQNADGTVTYTYRNGTTYTTTSTNSIVGVVENVNGSVTYTFRDNTSYTTLPKALNPLVNVIQNPDGTTTYTYFDGTNYTTVAGLGPKGDTGAAGSDGAPGGRGKQGKTGSIGNSGKNGDSGSNGAWWPGVVAGVGAGVIIWAVEDSQEKKVAQGDLIQPPVNSVMIDPGLPAAYSAQGDVYKIQKQ